MRRIKAVKNVSATLDARAMAADLTTIPAGRNWGKQDDVAFELAVMLASLPIPDGKNQATKFLVAALKGSSWTIRQAAAQHLGQLRAMESVQHLIAALSDTITMFAAR